MKRVEYIMPIDYMRGNLSGRQSLEYGAGKAYDIQVGSKLTADVYQPRVIAKVTRIGRGDALRFFQVRTKTSVNMTAVMKHNLALMGGVGAIFAAIVSAKQSQLYIECVRACPKDITLRGWLSPILRQGLAALESTFSIADGITINNPWVSGGNGVQVNIPQRILDKFASELGD